jgi:hypothetical protein
MIIYEGSSLIDGKPIVVIAINKSKNSKTGNVVQTYILRSDIDPLTANRTGEDYSICGECTLKGIPNSKKKGLATSRACYVQIGQAPMAIYTAYKKGSYRDASSKAGRNAIGSGRVVRIGSYGDGAAVPQEVWDQLVEEATSHTAYTHNHGNPEFYMKSVESLQEAEWNWDNGYRTFRIIRDKSEIVSNKEVLCPSDKGVTCNDCRLCGGSAIKAKSIAIQVHGAGTKWLP